MSSPIQISDDDDSIDLEDLGNPLEVPKLEDVVQLSSDEETGNLTSDDDNDVTNVNLKRSNVIKNLFPNKPSGSKAGTSQIPQTSQRRDSEQVATGSSVADALNPPCYEKMIGGVKVKLPVDPYGSQMALMSKVITAINRGQNCLLESPTGSGKTLALLCGALAWQQRERDLAALSEAQQSVLQHPELHKVKGAVDFIASPKTGSPDKLFGKTVFGERSIYDQPVQHQSGADASVCKRQEPMDVDDCEALTSNYEVTIHKKRKLNDDDSSKDVNESTPEKTVKIVQPETPPNIRNLYTLVQNLQLRTSMYVNCRMPIIYYGARTHKQLQQVIKEFKRTAYSGVAKMTVLSSREHSCIREFDKSLWASKNDMCRGCTKKSEESKNPESNRNKGDTNCKYFNNKVALTHERLPPAFDLEDLVSAGHDLNACPFYAARAMAASSQIIFCPYNYLIEPNIRSSLQIDLQNNIVIIDEAHNIEDICRDAATFTITWEAVKASIAELETVTSYRFAPSNSDSLSYLDYLLSALRNWNQWFNNQQPLVNSKPVNNNEAVHIWEVHHFIETLNNHNIHYKEFYPAAEVFSQRMRESPETMYGVTQLSSTLIESMSTVLGYIHFESGKYKEDFKPILVRNVFGGSDLSESKGWRNSQFNQWVQKDTMSLRLLCLNPGVVFEGLKNAKCIILASGTLTPLVSLHSELAAEFPLQVSPNHVIPADRVWIGTLTTCPDGQRLECSSRYTDQVNTQDALGFAVHWVCQVTPHGVLCFLPSYPLMNKLVKRWQETGQWRKLNEQKHVFMESKNARDHNEVMEDYYKFVATNKGALLFAVYRGKVSEGMDFKDHQARAVITVGVPYPNTYDLNVKEKMNYNDRYSADKKLLKGREWLRVQAYRALNQAVGRCVRHRGDWGAVLLVDARFTQPYYTEHLSKWVRTFLGNNHHTFESLANSPNGLETFMQNMTIMENEDLE